MSTTSKSTGGKGLVKGGRGLGGTSKGGKGLGKGGKGLGGAKRHRRVIRDSIAGVTKPAITRLAKRAGVKRQSGLIYEQIRGELRVYLEKICKDMIVFTQQSRRKTVTVDDLNAALSHLGIELGAGVSSTGESKSLKSCTSRGKRSGNARANMAGETVAKAHRFRPGTVSIRDIRKNQKNSDCLAIPKSNFALLVREILQVYVVDIRVQADVFALLQLTCENYIVKLLEAANLVAIHAGRETVSAKDISLVTKLSGLSISSC